MTDREFFIQTITDEIPRFERVIKAIPATNRDWRPDPKSKTAIELAQTIASESETFSPILTAGAYDFANYKKTSEEDSNGIVALLKASLMKVKDTAAGMTDEEWAGEGKILMGGVEHWKATRGAMVFSFLFDLIHHRGQLSTYLRAMGGKVPSIYGPSADDPGGM
jgi:uncharacterized damage-inducible protein DinB